jgi:hypothetical protein
MHQVFFNSMRFRCQLSLAAVASSVVLCVTSNPAQALTVQTTVDGTTYNVTTFTGTYNGNVAKFNTLGNNGLMPWWGSDSLATQFATQIGSSLGLPYLSSTGPAFAYVLTSNVSSRIYFPGSGIVGLSAELDGNQTYVIATLATPPAASVPGPLPLFGAAAAFGMSRRLRRRIQLGD